MKKFVIELLQQRQLLHVFNESDFKTYRAKVVNGQKDVNNYSAALNIMDMFILNSPAC